MSSKLHALRRALSDAELMAGHPPVCVVLRDDHALAGAVAAELDAIISDDLAGHVRGGLRAGGKSRVFVTGERSVSELVLRLAQYDAGATNTRVAHLVLGDPSDPTSVLWVDIASAERLSSGG